MDELEVLRRELNLTTEALIEARRLRPDKPFLPDTVCSEGEEVDPGESWDETTAYIVKVPKGRGWGKWKNEQGKRTEDEARLVAEEAMKHHGRARIVKVRTRFHQETVCTLPPLSEALQA